MKKFKQIISVLTVVVGIVAIILGISVMGTDVSNTVEENSFKHVTANYDAGSAAFGADFYTYIYDASDIIVDELNDINMGIATVVRAQDAINEAACAAVEATDALTASVNRIGGILIMLFGAVVMLSGFKSVIVEFDGFKGKKADAAAESNSEEPACC